MDDMENIMSIPDPGTAAGVVYLSLTHASSTHSTRFTIHLHHSTNNTANFAGQRLMSHLDQDMEICVQATATYHELSFYFQIRVGMAHWIPLGRSHRYRYRIGGRVFHHPSCLADSAECLLLADSGGALGVLDSSAVGGMGL